MAYARLSSTRPRPSKDTHAVLRELKGTQTRTSMLSGKSMGRKDSVCGAIGVIRIEGISGWTSEPPADNCTKESTTCAQITKDTRIRTEYAVDPVGVEIVRPSPCTVAMWCSSP